MLPNRRLSGLLYLSNIRATVEIDEESCHSDSVKDTPHAEIVVDEAVDRIHEINEELDNLKLRDSSLPARPCHVTQRVTVVVVEDDVDERVESEDGSDGGPGRARSTVIGEDEHAAVMEHVQEADLTRLVAQQHKDGVEQLQYFHAKVHGVHVRQDGCRRPRVQ